MVYRYATARNLLGGRGAGTKCCVAQPKRIQVKPLTLTSALRKSPSWVSGIGGFFMIRKRAQIKWGFLNGSGFSIDSISMTDST